MRRTLPLLLSLLLAACTTTPPPGPDPDARGTISGSVRVGGGGAAILEREAARQRAFLEALEQPGAAAAEFVPGEVIVKFKSTRAPQALLPLRAGGVTLNLVRPLALSGARLYRSSADRETTLELVKTLSRRPDVLYAQPNYLRRATATPNDPFYGAQWHYPAINLPQAWDLTTGSTGTVVAVIDTGILYDPADPSRTHPDFVGKVLPGFDFISSASNARDGDGRDPNPFDEGDTPDGQSSYHGSHVAGTVAAATNNGVGVAGVDWNAQILPVRVLGVEGGTVADINDAVLWTAGFSVAGVPDNPNPAHIINLSLGGPPVCSPAEQAVFDQVVAAGTIVVVAAGNDNMDAGGFSPASCAGVITVGATDFNGSRAPYSNYGAALDVMAPGGDTDADANGDGFPDGVLSPVLNDSNGTFDYGFYNGTSMAAPHVAGVISLMRALEPDLTGEAALSLLRSTARPLTTEACARTLATDCGAGLIDAFAALQAVGDPPPAPGGTLSFSPNPLDFGVASETLPLTLTNTSGSSVTWQIVGFEVYPSNPGETPDGTLFVPDGALSGTLEPAASATLTLGVDRTLLGAEGVYALDLIFSVGGSEQRLPIRVTKTSSTTDTPAGPFAVAAAIQNAQGEYELSGPPQEGASFFSDYSLSVTPGNNIVFAFSDENRNNELDDGDFFGAYPVLVPVAPGGSATGINFDITRLLTLGDQVSRSDEANLPTWTPELRNTLEQLYQRNP